MLLIPKTTQGNNQKHENCARESPLTPFPSNLTSVRESTNVQSPTSTSYPVAREIRVPASSKVNSRSHNAREEEDRGGGLESAASGAQMVPSGGLLRAKMAPAGTQMGSSNLINAGIVSTRWTGGRLVGGGGRKRKRGGITHTGSKAADVCMCGHKTHWHHRSRAQKTKPFGSAEVKPGPRAFFQNRSRFNSLSCLKVRFLFFFS